jgi:AmiR/NasT family two-component response regulator
LQFRSALASRDVIGQAKGMIMERFSIDAVHAFELLKKLSQQSNTRIVEIASNLVARGSEPTTEGER